MRVNIDIPDDLHWEYKKLAFNSRARGKKILEKQLYVKALKIALTNLKEEYGNKENPEGA